jgi:TolB-like protein
VLYQLLTGQPPFAGGTTYETVKLLLETEPRPPRVLNPKVDRDLSAICLKCLEKDPKRRYSSALALTEDLEHWLRHEPIQAKPGGFLIRARKWVRRNPTTSMLLALLLTLCAVLSLTVRHRQPPLPIQKTLAALPFEAQSDDPDDYYLAEGIQQQILARLAGIADLKVMADSFTRHYQIKSRNLLDIAKQLGAANILEGAVQKTVGRVRVSVRLINPQNDSQLWAQTYDQKDADLVDIESDVAKRIANTLQTKLTSRDEQDLAAKPTSSSEAYEAYLRGLGFSISRFGLSAEDATNALRCYERAVLLDPKFAIAWARLSRVYANLCLVDNPEAKSAHANSAKRALDKAQKLAPSSNETLLALGYYEYWVLRDFDAAVSTFRRVTQKAPGNSEVPWAFGLITRPEGNSVWILNPANGHEYRLTTGYYWGVSDTVARTRPDWFDAEGEAAACGGHLVTINNEAENKFLVSLFVPGDPTFDAWGSFLWIGLSDYGSEKSFYWISGETATFTSWDIDQPDNAHQGGEDSVHTNHFGGLGLWNDLGAQGNSPHHPSPYRGIIERSN